MPEHTWTCGTCSESNPPYTEACRSCYRPASKDGLLKKASPQLLLTNECPICDIAISCNSDRCNCIQCGAELLNVDGQWHAIAVRDKYRSLVIYPFISITLVLLVLVILGQVDSAYASAAFAMQGIAFMLLATTGISQGYVRPLKSRFFVVHKRNPNLFVVEILMQFSVALWFLFLAMKLWGT